MTCKFCKAEIDENLNRCPVCNADLTLTDAVPLSIRTRNSAEAEQIAQAFADAKVNFSAEETDGLFLFLVDSAEDERAKEILLQVGVLENATEEDGCNCPDADADLPVPAKKPSVMGRVMTVFLLLLLVAAAVWGTDALMAFLKQIFHIR